MDEVNAILDRVYAGREVLGLSTIYEDLVAAAAPEQVLRAVESMPEGSYRKDEVVAAVNAAPGVLPGDPGPSAGQTRPVEESQAYDLAADDEAPDPDLDYRGPGRADPDTPTFQEPSRPADADDYFVPGDGLDVSDDGKPVRTGADQPWDPEDLAVAQGWDPTPANIERARRQLEKEGPSAIERNVP
jgi:hypothetical protein